MKQSFALLVVILGIWTAVASLIFGYSFAAIVNDAIVGILLIAISAAVLAYKGDDDKVDGVQSKLLIADAALGVWLLVSAFLFGAIRPSAIICGILVVALAVFGSKIKKSNKMIIAGRDGKMLVEVNSVEADGDRVLIKGKLFGNMPQSMYLSGGDVWSMLGMLPLSFFFALPKILSSNKKAGK